MIFYFSGTGNTRWAAEQLAEATQERLYFIPDELKGVCRYQLNDDERIGFCFPVHGWQPPRIVRQFISRLTFDRPQTDAGTQPPTPYCYALCTCGDNMGQAMTILNKELAKKGLKAETQLSLIMPESYVCLPFMYTDTPAKEQQKIKNAGVLLEQFKHIVCRRERGYVNLVKGAIPRTYSYLIGQYFNQYMITDKKFMVSRDACQQCGRCARECPVGDIILVDGRPTWKNNHSCTCCLSCYHHCPDHAINYGRITRHRGQYYFKAEK